MTTLELFIKTANRVITSGKTKNAKNFATKICDQILNKGIKWIKKNKDALGISEINFAMYADGSGEIAPIEDNRIRYLEKWQLALFANG